MEKEIELILDSCIYHSNNHCAFTSIILEKEQILVAFREGKAHRPTAKEDYGSISILKKDRNDWVKISELKNENMDLRDPFFIHINDTLRLYCGFNQFYDGIYQHRGTVYSKLTEEGWSDYMEVQHDVPHIVWMWKIREYNGSLYSIGYLEGEKPVLLNSRDGKTWKTINIIDLDGILSEADMCFIGDSIYIVLRQDVPLGSPSLWGQGKYPFKEIKWSVMDKSIASPEMYYNVETNQILIAGREYVSDEKNNIKYGEVTLWAADKTGDMKHIFSFEDSKGWDNGYPSFEFIGSELLMSYYNPKLPNMIRLALFELVTKIKPSNAE